MLFMFESQKNQAMLYYLCMMSDGEVSKGELKIFDQICKDMDIDNDDKKEIISECQKLYKEHGDSLEVIKAENIAENAGVYIPLEKKSSIYSPLNESISAGISGVFSGLDEDEVDDDWEEAEDITDNKDAAPIIWNLINLVYADQDFSADEKRIVYYLANKWKFRKELFQEMIDTAETILALSKEKEWILKNVSDGNNRDKKEKAIKRDIKSLYVGIKTSIVELSL